MKTYTCTYTHAARRHVVHVEADSWDDAAERLRAIGETGTVDGELVAEGALPSERGINLAMAGGRA